MSQIAEIWSRNNWLPVVDAFRTLAACPPPDGIATLQQIQWVAAA
jgi:hypothetical protein